MKIKSYFLSGAATGYSPWHFLDWRQNPFAVSFLVDYQGGGTLAYTVEYGYSDLAPKPVHITNSTTTATVTYPNHGLVTGDSVIISGAEYADGTDQTATTLNGTYQVTRTGANTFTYVHTTNDGTKCVNPARAIFIRVMTHDTYGTSAIASTDGNLAFSVQATRIKVTTLEAATSLVFHVSQGSN
jgi:hypothetical protein